MDSNYLNIAQSVLDNANGGGGGKPKTPAPPAPAPKTDTISDEMKILYNRNMNYDNRPARDIVNEVAQKQGVNPSLLFSSAFQEGMNKAIAKPDTVSQDYINAKLENSYPVDGFYNYGLDTFGDNYQRLKKYLPDGFDKEFKSFPATNEKGQTVNSAAFKTNEAALTAKAAMLKDAAQQVQDYAKAKNITIDPSHLNYFTLAGYNSGMGDTKKMIDQYAAAKDKNAFISQGLTTLQGVHKNIAPRLERMKLAEQLLNQKDVATK